MDAEQIGGKRFAPHLTTVMSGTRGAEAHLGVVAKAGRRRSLAEGEAPRPGERVDEHQDLAADGGTAG